MDENLEHQLKLVQDDNDLLRRQLADLSFKKTTELNTLRSRCVKLDTNYSIVSAELSASVNENVLLRQQMSQLVSNSSTDKLLLKTTVKEFEDRLNIKNKTIDSLSLENDKMKKETVSYKYTKTQELHVLNLKVTELETITTVVRDETSRNIQAISTRFQEITRERDVLKSLLFNLSSNHNSDRHNDDGKDVVSELMSVYNKMEAGMREISTRLEHFHGISADNTELFNTINKLTQENNELSVKLNKTNKKLNANILKLQTELISKNSEIMNLNSSISDLTNSIRVSEQTNNLKFSHLESLYETVKTQQQDHLNKFNTAAFTLRDDMDKLLVENNEQLKDLNKLQMDVNDWMGKCNTAQLQLKSTIEELTLCKQKHTKEVDEWRETVQRLKTTLQDTIEAHQKREGDLTQQLTFVQNQLDLATTDLNTAKSTLSTTATALETCTINLTNLEQKHSDLQLSHDDALQQCAEILKSLEESEDEQQQQSIDNETVVTGLRNEISELEKSKHVLTIQYQNLEINFNAVIEENNTHTTTIAELNNEIETLQDKIQSLSLTKQQSDQTLSCQQKALNDTIAGLHEEKYELESKLKSRLEELLQLHTKYKAISESHDALMLQLEACEQKLSDKNQENTSLLQDLTQSSTSLSTANTNIISLEIEVNELRSKVDELTNTMNSRSTKYKVTQSKIIELEKSLAEVRKNLKLSFDGNQLEVKQLNDKLQKAEEALQLKEDEVTSQTQFLRNVVISKEKTIEELNNEMLQQKHLISQLECGLVELRDVNQEEQCELLATINTLESTNESLSLQLTQQSSLFDAKQNEVEELSSELVEAKFKIDSLTSDIAVHLSTVKMLEDRLTQSEQLNVATTTTLANSTVEASEQIKTLQLELQDKIESVKKLESVLRECQDNNTILTEQLQKTSSEVTEKQQVITQLEKTLQTFQQAAQSTIENQAQLIDSLEAKHGSFHESFRSLEQQLLVKEQEMKILRLSQVDAVNLLEIRLLDVQKSLQFKEEEVVGLQLLYKESVNESRAVQQTLEERDSELTTLRNTHAELSNSLSIQSANSQSLQDHNTSLLSEVSRLEETLRTTLTSHSQELQSLSQQQVTMVNKLSVKLNHRNDAIKLLKAEIARLKDSKRADHKDLSSMLSGLQSEFDALHLHIAEFSTEPSSVSSSVETLGSTLKGNHIATTSATTTAAATTKTMEPLPSPPRHSKSSNSVIVSSSSVDAGGPTGVGVAGGSVMPMKSPTRVKVELLPSS